MPPDPELQIPLRRGLVHPEPGVSIVHVVDDQVPGYELPQQLLRRARAPQGIGVLDSPFEPLPPPLARAKRSDELGALLKALSGIYIEPRVAGDPIRTPEVFPTGSHGYAFDPRLTPSRAAYVKGIKIAEELVRRYRERYKRYPESMGFVLWGFETAQTKGETIGSVLQLLGVKLTRDKGPWTPRLEVIPLEQLGRPRIDVTMTICGFFRDMFPISLRW